MTARYCHFPSNYLRYENEIKNLSFPSVCGILLHSIMNEVSVVDIYYKLFFI